MTRWFISAALCAALLGGGSAALAETAATPGYDEGIEYQRIKYPQEPLKTKDKIEVVELFWYGCPHCSQLEPQLNAWLANKPEDVEFVRVPAILGPNWELMARAFFTAELLGVQEEIHEPLFELIHKKKDRKIHSKNGLMAFFADHGVDNATFNNTFESFAVTIRLNQARMLTRSYGISGVPTLIVGGKYRTEARTAGGNVGMLQVVDHLIEKERNADKQLADSQS